MWSFSKGFALNRLAKTAKEVFEHISTYRISGDVDNLYKAAWLLQYGVYDSCEKYHWSPFTRIWIPNYHSLGRLTINEVIKIAVGKIMTESSNLPEYKQHIVEDILEKGEEYDKHEHLISQRLKDKLLP